MLERLKEIYEKKYKLLMLIPIVILLLSVGVLFYWNHSTGEYISKDVSLKGGLLLSVETSQHIDISAVASAIEDELGATSTVKALRGVGSGEVIGYTFEVETGPSVSEVKDTITRTTGLEIIDGKYTVEETSASLSESFWDSTIKAIMVAFLFMSIFVFFYFRKLAPSLAIIAAAAFDLIGTLAVMNILGMKLSTAGVAALLMLIGYSVDTDILLSTRVLKRKEIGSVMARVYSAMKTGLLMQGTTMTALIIIFVISPAAVLRSIASVLIIGLLLDLPNTWIQNVGILRMYLEKKEEHNESA